MRFVPCRRGRTKARASPSAVHVQTIETSNMFQELACHSLTPDVLFGTTPGLAEEAMPGYPNYSLSLPTGVPIVRRLFVPVRSPVPVIVPAFKPTHALVMNAAKNLLQKSGPR